MIRSALGRWAACSVGAALAFCQCAFAGNFSANPVRLTLSAKARTTSLTLENKGEQPVQVQAEVMVWSQQDGVDVLAPSRDLLISPPIFTLAPGAAQTVRVGLLRTPDPARELTYRLFLQEVPPLPPPGQQGVSMVLRLGLPVFVAPPVPTSPALRWQLKAESANAITLTLSNSRNTHVQVIEVKLFMQDGTPLADKQLASYVLAERSRSWRLESRHPWRGEKLQLKAKTDGGDVTVEIGSEDK